MKMVFWVLLTGLCFLASAHAASKKQALDVIEGKISAFESADNFYLTIVDKKGKQHTALCAADLCEKLMLAADDTLGGYKGRKVRVTVGTGKQVDGSGQVMGVMEAFVKIQLLK
jgi:hypothetical protein